MNFEQSWTRIAKESEVLHIGAHVALQVGKSQDFLRESPFIEYKQQRIASL